MQVFILNLDNPNSSYGPSKLATYTSIFNHNSLHSIFSCCSRHLCCVPVTPLCSSSLKWQHKPLRSYTPGVRGRGKVGVASSTHLHFTHTFTGTNSAVWFVPGVKEGMKLVQQMNATKPPVTVTTSASRPCVPEYAQDIFMTTPTFWTYPHLLPAVGFGVCVSVCVSVVSF